MGTPAITVIVPTRGLPTRATLIGQALESVRTQEGVQPVPLLVVNGPSADPALLRSWREDRDLRLLQHAHAHLPTALAIGRAAVETDWFATLDDDDVLLPGALRLRWEVLANAPEYDLVVTNGYIRRAGEDTLLVQDPGPIRRDPLRALLDNQWMLPGSYLGRTDRVGPDAYEGMPPYLENTFLAARFASEYRLLFDERPTVVWNVDTPDSTSQSPGYLPGQVEALRTLLRLPLPPAIRAGWQRRITRTCHAVSERARRQGDLSAAWRWHLRSLRERAGWRHLLYTRHLLWPWWHGRRP